MAAIEKTEARSLKRAATDRSPAENILFKISICLIEILNCTFDLKPLYQRYIQVALRARPERCCRTVGGGQVVVAVGRSSLVRQGYCNLQGSFLESASRVKLETGLCQQATTSNDFWSSSATLENK
jgi:hypothetical protein